MATKNNFKVKLDKVDGKGLPRNRRLWCYDLTVPKGSHKELCLDFIGNLSITDPGNFDAKTATDHAGFKWKGASKRKTNPTKPKGSKNITTDICLKSTNKKGTTLAANTKIKFCFIGPADGKAGGVSIHSVSRIKIPNSNRWIWTKLNNGVQSSIEAPLAVVIDDDTQDKHSTSSTNIGNTHLSASSYREIIAAVEAAIAEIMAAIIKKHSPIENAAPNVVEEADTEPQLPSTPAKTNDEIDPSFSDEIDLDELLKAEIAELDLSDIDEALISNLKGLTAADAKKLVQTLNVKTLGDLLNNDMIKKVIKLSRLL